jgi:hypothetical protein
LNEAVLDLLEGHWESAREGFDAVRRMAAEAPRSEQAILYLGAISYATGNLEMSRSWWEQANEVCHSKGDSDCLASVRLWEGRAALGKEDLASARARLGEAEQHFRDVDHLPGLIAALESLAELALAANESTVVKARLEEASRLRQRLGLSEMAVGLEAGAEPKLASDENNPRFERLLFLLRANPRTALSELRLARLAKGLEQVSESTSIF